MKQLKESGRLTQEQVAIGEESHRAHGRAHGIGGPDDRAHRKGSAQEGAGLRHDQVGLEQLPAKRGLIQVGKDQSSVLGSVSGGALPALSNHVWKCAVSVGPMLSRIRRTSTFVTL